MTSEDNTTSYWREQQAWGKLQIADETEQWANEYKKQAAATNATGRNFTKLRNFNRKF
jgi:hypothetical protein